MLSPAEIEAGFQQVAQRLSQESWFQAGQWQSSVHLFPPEQATAMTFQLSKPHWYNAAYRGIHLESYLAFDSNKQKQSYVTLHLLHLPKLPGTPIARKRLAEIVVDQLAPEIEKWSGYRFRAGRYGQQPFVRDLDGTSPDFFETLADELTRLAVRVGPVIDQALIDLLAENLKPV